MDSYLKNIKISLTDSSTINNVTIVMGNEASDLDSSVSALVYAFFLHWINPDKNTPDSVKLYIPILNVKREDLPLKTEVIYYLRENSISLENVLCRDEYDIESLLSKHNGHLILVDHHILSKADENLFEYVSEIFDHRPKDISLWKYDERVWSKINEVGSCATIITSEIINEKRNINFLTENLDVSNLLYGTIVLDTINFLPSADKARPLDFEMIEQLKNILSIENIIEHKKLTFQKLHNARTDYSTLSVHHLLKRDMKLINGNICIPGLPMLVEEYLGMQDSYEAVKSFFETNKLSVILLMGIKVIDGVVQRDMALYGDTSIVQAIIHNLCKSTNPKFDLIEKACISEFKYFKQSNTKASRKQIIPLIKEILP